MSTRLRPVALQIYFKSGNSHTLEIPAHFRNRPHSCHSPVDVQALTLRHERAEANRRELILDRVRNLSEKSCQREMKLDRLRSAQERRGERL